jgi:hypothetical protein
VVIPGGVTTINHSAFASCAALTSVAIPNGVTEIGSNAFANCANLASVTIPDGVTAIGDNAFSNCENLQFTEYGNCKYLGNASNPHHALIMVSNSNVSSCTIHKDTKMIANNVFSNCIDLTGITVDANNTVYQSIDGNLYSKDGKTLIQYAIGKTDKSFTISDNVTSIDKYAFANCTALESIVVSESVKKISDNAFDACANLKAVYYKGSETDWKKIEIIEKGNSNFVSAKRYYDAQEPLPPTTSDNSSSSSSTTSVPETSDSGCGSVVTFCYVLPMLVAMAFVRKRKN